MRSRMLSVAAISAMVLGVGAPHARAMPATSSAQVQPGLPAAPPPDLKNPRINPPPTAQPRRPNAPDEPRAGRPSNPPANTSAHAKKHAKTHKHRTRTTQTSR